MLIHIVNYAEMVLALGVDFRKSFKTMKSFKRLHWHPHQRIHNSNRKMIHLVVNKLCLP